MRWYNIRKRESQRERKKEREREREKKNRVQTHRLVKVETMFTGHCVTWGGGK